MKATYSKTGCVDRNLLYVIYKWFPSTLASSTCTRDWIEIYSSNEVCSDTGNLHNRYCGLTFGANIASDTDQDFNSESTLSKIMSRPQRTVCGKKNFFHIIANQCIEVRFF